MGYFLGIVFPPDDRALWAIQQGSLAAGVTIKV